MCKMTDKILTEIMAVGRAPRQTKKKLVEQTVPSKQYDIPYFAHMQLDPAHFPEGESLCMIK